ncbi:hypothetical protein MMC34_006729 [Xylographa carneopallida]|nr:hypothetical protein [Xylographa carneopallida]
MAAIDAFQMIPSLGGKPWHGRYWRGKRVFLTFPLFHAAGLGFLLPICIYHGIIPVLPPANGPLTAEIANSVNIYGNVRMGLFPPSMLVDLARDPVFLDNLRHLEHVSFGGGPLPKDIGDLISTKTRVSACFGTTEAAFYPTELSEPEDWQYFSFSPFLGQEFRHFGDDLYEHILVRSKSPELAALQGIFFTFPDLDEFATKDLYSKHPSRVGWWLYRGRADDIIVFSNGEKLNPLAMEATIESHPAVLSALIGGHGKFQSVLLVEPVTPPSTEQEAEELLTKLWPTIEKANRQSPAHGRLFKDLVTFTSAEKPMLRAGKGTVQRRKTFELYEEELNALYGAPPADAEDSIVQDSPSKSDRSTTEKEFLHLVRTATKLDITLTGNMFEVGLDSLQVLNLVKQINSMQVHRGQGRGLTASKTIYAHPTVHDLYLALTQPATKPADDDDDRSRQMQRYLSLHTSDLPFNTRPPIPSANHPLVVLLTGSTGSLGSYLLDALIRDPSVAQIYCLNRRPDAQHHQRDLHTTRGLCTTFPHTEFLQSDPSQPYLGLSPAVYHTLLRSVTHILHNAWAVNFNLPLAHYAAQLHGVRRLVDFASQSAHGAVLFFVSSISAVLRWGHTTTTTTTNHTTTTPSISTSNGSKVPETPLADFSLPERMGYGESKFVAERLLAAAHAASRIPIAICRVGQIAGPLSRAGMWSPAEFVPSIVLSSAHLGLLPASLGAMDAVDWLPVDALAPLLLDLLKSHAAGTAAENARPAVYHAVNPAPTTWGALVPTVQRRLATWARPVRVVPFAEWVARLRESAAEAGEGEGEREAVGRNPAVKLMDFLEGIQVQGDAGVVVAGFETGLTAGRSQILGGVGPVRGEWVEGWMRQWGV